MAICAGISRTWCLVMTVVVLVISDSEIFRQKRNKLVEGLEELSRQTRVNAGTELFRQKRIDPNTELFRQKRTDTESGPDLSRQERLEDKSESNLAREKRSEDELIPPSNKNKKNTEKRSGFLRGLSDQEVFRQKRDESDKLLSRQTRLENFKIEEGEGL
ncbi:hypothetical protein Bpfe_024832 [Biomphalaria pfeifferi]|uniref:Uncharacterized protein n=1 Tax=Biomphalaria pfeifferi TaxID=112525 RepID=A0AAD8F0N4_BIOPF|nr:hypothetical protein Bpfe_024832 [Biomphalaria pfeifferi]